ncbi:MAG TPA: hypothetical protein VGM82_04570 [Gemmatimonadaceae bacterium]|jgi:predicted GTPase
MQSASFSSLQRGGSNVITLQAPADTRDAIQFRLDRNVADEIVLPDIVDIAAVSTLEDRHFSYVLTDDTATVECSREVAWIVLRAVQRITQNPKASLPLVTHAATAMMMVQSLLLAKR